MEQNFVLLKLLTLIIFNRNIILFYTYKRAIQNFNLDNILFIIIFNKTSCKQQFLLNMDEASQAPKGSKDNFLFSLVFCSQKQRYFKCK